MLGTFDLGDVDFRSPDEILATLDAIPAVSEADDPPKASAMDAQASTANVPAVEDVESDEILRELEEHHSREQTSTRTSPPRGSAEFRPTPRRNGSSTRRRKARSHASRQSKPRGGRKRHLVSLAVAAMFAASASAVTLSQLSGTGLRPTTPVRSSRLVANTTHTLAPTTILDAMANAIASKEQQLTRRVTAPAKHHPRKAIVRKHSARHHPVAPVAPAMSTSPVSSTHSYGSSDTAATSSSQPAATATTPASSTASHQSQPAFGLNGSLGPGRGAPGTQ